MIVTGDLAALLNACHAAPLDWQAKVIAADKADEDGITPLSFWLRWMASHCEGVNPLRSRREIHDLAVPTGSRVYGCPRADSDWDWVVPMLPGYEHHWEPLEDVCGPLGSEDYIPPITKHVVYRGPVERPLLCGAYRFGPVNMICVDSKEQLRVWTEGTATLKASVKQYGSGHTRETAVATFQQLGGKYL